MLKVMRYSLQTLSSFSCKKMAFLAVFLFFSEVTLNSSFAQNPELNDSIVKEIESTLLFSEDEKKTLGSRNNKSKKSDFTIERGKTAQSPSVAVKIDVNDVKVENISVREKERIAYNASLIEQYEVSIQLYKEILLAEPGNDYAKFSLAVLYQKIGQISQAKALYYEILKNDPENKDEVISNLLSALISESPRDAIYLLSRLASQNPESSYIVAQAALAYDKLKDYDNAIAMLKKAISLQPERLDYKYNLAVMYDKSGDYNNALNSYSNVIKGYDETSSQQISSLDQIKQRVESIKSIL
jgi:tetratricopeptide (TPR) repeat protein